MADIDTPPFDPFDLVKSMIREQCPPATGRGYRYMWEEFRSCRATPLDSALATLVVFAERLREAGSASTTAVEVWNDFVPWESVEPTETADRLRAQVRQYLEVAGRFDFRSPGMEVLRSLCRSLPGDESLRSALRAIYYAAYEFASTADEARVATADEVLDILGEALDLPTTL